MIQNIYIMKLSKNYKKQKASSLVETIVATTISAICLSIAVLVFVQISNNSDSLVEIKASQALNLKMYEDWLTTSTEDDIFPFMGFSIERIKLDATENEKWIEVTYKAKIINKIKTKKQFIIQQ